MNEKPEAESGRDSRTPEFSHPIPVGRIHKTPSVYRIAADEAARQRLARRFGLVSVERLEAEVKLRRLADESIRLEAEFAAAIVQYSVVSNQPVPEEVADRFVLIYRPGIDEDEADALALADPSEEVIEPLMGDSIDIGEAVAQELSVAMDPYPRVAGEQWSEGEEDAEPEPPVRRSPFEALAALKKST